MVESDENFSSYIRYFSSTLVALTLAFCENSSLFQTPWPGTFPHLSRKGFSGCIHLWLSKLGTSASEYQKSGRALPRSQFIWRGGDVGKTEDDLDMWVAPPLSSHIVFSPLVHLVSFSSPPRLIASLGKLRSISSVLESRFSFTMSTWWLEYLRAQRCIS